MADHSDYVPASPEALADPHGAARFLLDKCPVHKEAVFGYYTFAKHADVAECSRDHRRYTASTGQAPVDRPGAGLFNDPPEHTMFRQMVAAWFTPKRIEAQTPMVSALAHDLVDLMEARGTRTGELHDDVACPLPVITIARIMGVAEEDRDTFKYWSDMEVAAMGRSDGSNRETQKAMGDYLRAAVQLRRRLLAEDGNLPDDLISGLVAAAAAAPRPIDDDEILGMLRQLLVGGNETTTSLITNCVWRLLERPELWHAVVNDPSLVEVAVEESLRFDPPVLGLWRKTVEPMTKRGVDLPAGARIQMSYLAANRDDEVFDDPETFRLDRDLTTLKRTHLSFGYGVHLCIGASLARNEAIVSVRTLVERLPGLRLNGDTERIEPFFLWGRHRLPVAW